MLFVRGSRASLKRGHRTFDLLGERPQFLSEFGKPVASDASLEEAAAETLLKLSQPPVHGGLTYTKGFRRRQGAAFTGERQEGLQVIPVEHASSMQLCGTFRQTCGYPNTARQSTLIALAAEVLWRWRPWNGGTM